MFQERAKALGCLCAGFVSSGISCSLYVSCGLGSDAFNVMTQGLSDTLGIQTGKMAAKILTGEATCQDLPYEVIENYSLYVNSNALAQMGITLPDDLAQEAEEVGATA